MGRVEREGDDYAYYGTHHSCLGSAKDVVESRVSRNSLYRFGVLAWSNLGALAELWIEELSRVGMRALEGGAVSKEPASRPRDSIGEFDGPGRVPIKLPSNRKVWLNLDTPRNESGYRLVEVWDTPDRTEQAIVAMLVVLELSDSKVDGDAAHRALVKTGPPLRDSVWEYLPSLKRWRGPAINLCGAPEQPELTPEEKEVEGLLMPQYRAVELVLEMLRRHHADFDDRGFEDQAEMVGRALKFARKIQENVLQLNRFVEYGRPGGLPNKEKQKVERDMGAALLRAAEGRNNAEIGRMLGIPLADSDQVKNDNQNARKAANRGEELIVNNLGDGDWSELVQKLKDEASGWCSKDPKDRELDRIVEATAGIFEESSVSKRDARRYLKYGTTKSIECVKRLIVQSLRRIERKIR